MITDATTTEDLIATFGNARALGAASFEQGCTVLDAIEMFDNRAGGGKLGTWREYSSRARIALPFVPATDPWDDRNAHRLVCEQLARTVVAWTCRQPDARQLNHELLERGSVFTAWVVIDRATRVAWVECSLVKDQRAQHPRDLREAGEFPSSSKGTVDAHVFLRMGEPWRDTLDGVSEAYHEAKETLDREAAQP
jgi:hypothetical protein